MKVGQLFLFCFCLLLLQCKEGEQGSSVTDLGGDWHGKVYQNTYFGLQVRPPQGWYVEKGDFPRGRELAKQWSGQPLAQNVINPFWVFRHPPESELQPKVNFSLEMKPTPEGVADGKELLRALENALPPSIIFEKEAQLKQVGEVPLWIQNISVKKGNAVIKQRFFAMVKGRYCLLMAIKYDEGVGEKEAMLMEQGILALKQD